jgi:hypothetical protein
VHTSEHVEQCLYSEIDKVSTDERYEEGQLARARLQDKHATSKKKKGRLESSISFFAILSDALPKDKEPISHRLYKRLRCASKKGAPTREEESSSQ